MTGYKMRFVDWVMVLLTAWAIVLQCKQGDLIGALVNAYIFEFCIRIVKIRRTMNNEDV